MTHELPEGAERFHELLEENDDFYVKQAKRQGGRPADNLRGAAKGKGTVN